MDKPRITPKDVFLHLFNIIIFYLTVIGFIMLYVQYINVWLPDILNFYFTGIANMVRVATAIFVIAAPFYLLTYWMLSRDLKGNPEKFELSLRKWLIYFTLFISAITIIVDLVIFVYNFLDGELSARFFLKVLVVLVAAVAVFGYYFWDLKRTDFKSKLPKILAVVLVVLAAASVIIGIFLIGTPADQRARRFDDSRLQALQTLQSQVVDYWSQKEFLPAELKDLEDSVSGFKVPVDPETKRSYEYAITGDLSFELCAYFVTDSEDFPNSKDPSVYYSDARYPLDSYQQNWAHQVGRACFSREIDPDLYGPRVRK